MRLPNSAHTSRPWRIHELTPDFRLEDVPHARRVALESPPPCERRGHREHGGGRVAQEGSSGSRVGGRQAYGKRREAG